MDLNSIFLLELHVLNCNKSVARYVFDIQRLFIIGVQNTATNFNEASHVAIGRQSIKIM